MFNITKWFKDRRDKQFEGFLKKQRQIEQAQKDAEENYQRELQETAQKFLEQEKEAKKNSNDPWIDLVGEKIVDGRVAIILDWNDAFIRYLKQECHFEGDEEQIVQKWLGALAREIYDDSKNDALNILKQFPEEAEFLSKHVEPVENKDIN